MLETDSGVSVDDVIISFGKEYNDIDKQLEGSEFIFVGSLSIRCDKVNELEGSSYNESPKCLRYKNATINPKKLMIDVFRRLLCIHNTINIEIVKLGKNQHNIIHKSIK